MNKTWLYILAGVAVVLVIVVLANRQQSDAPAGNGNSPYFSTDVKGLAEAKPVETVELKNGNTFELVASIVKKEINGSSLRMLAYNGSVPGPVIKVAQDAEVTINFTNNTDVDTTIHPHGVRVENAFDGVPDVTQKKVGVGEQFTYKLKFPDPGLYWYHPHVRQDYAQDAGLYGAFLVTPKDGNYWSSVNREEVWMVDDVLIENGQLAAYNKTQVDHMLMGRFGNTMLINGSADYSLAARQSEVVRFYINNAANTRTFNLSIQGAKMKLVGADNGKYEKETFVNSILLAPSERAIIEVLFEKAGTYQVQHQTPDKTYLMGTINISTESAAQSYAGAFQATRANADVTASINPFRSNFSRKPDKQLNLTLDMQGMGGTNMHGQHQMPNGSMMDNSMMGGVSMADGDKIEWEDTMAMMNNNSTPDSITWKMVDQETGKANMDVAWKFKVGDKVKVRIFNDPKSMHPMQHPIHFHGQRFLVLATNGTTNTNLAWKDTVLVQTGDTVDILVDMSNPGTWMAHCHISEHPEAGMMTQFTITN